MTVQKVGIVIHEGVQALDVAGPLDAFGEANKFTPSDERYEVVLIGASRDPVRASNNMRVLADATFAEAEDAFDILLVAGGPSLPRGRPDDRLIEYLRRASGRASIYGSVCTGAFPLGHAGLLDGRRVTTHWRIARELAERFPAARVEPDAIFIQDGKLITSAGITAGIDLALALVNRRYGPDVSVAVAKHLVVLAQRQGGQSQFSPYLMAPADPTSPIRRVQDHVMANVGRRHSLKSLADVAGMSTRSLARHFVQETGVTPHRFVENARLDAARKLLEGSDRSLKAVAYDTGFVTADHMRVVFNDRLGIGPAQYRRRFSIPVCADWPASPTHRGDFRP